MISFYIAAVVFIGIIVMWYVIDGKPHFLDFLSELPLYMFFSGIISGALWFILAIFSLPLFGTETVSAVEHKLVATNTANGLSGQFFLGIGGIGNGTYIRFIEENPDGSMTINEYPASNSRIIETNDVDPVVVVESSQMAAPEWTPITNDGYNINNIFYVPVGSVVREYTISP